MKEFISSMIFVYKVLGSIFTVLGICLIPFAVYIFTDEPLWLFLFLLTIPFGIALASYWANRADFHI